MDALGKTLKEKTITLNKSCIRRTAKRGNRNTVQDGGTSCDQRKRQSTTERSMFKDVLKKLQKEREEEDAACALIEEKQHNLDEAQARASAN